MPSLWSHIQRKPSLHMTINKKYILAYSSWTNDKKIHRILDVHLPFYMMWSTVGSEFPTFLGGKIIFYDEGKDIVRIVDCFFKAARLMGVKKCIYTHPKRSPQKGLHFIHGERLYEISADFLKNFLWYSKKTPPWKGISKDPLTHDQLDRDN